MENSACDIIEEEKKDQNKVQDISDQQSMIIEKQDDKEELKQSVDDKDKSLINNDIKDGQDQVIVDQSIPQVDQSDLNQNDDGNEGDKSGQIPAQVQSQKQAMNSVNDDGDEEIKFEEEKVKARPMNDDDNPQVNKLGKKKQEDKHH